MGRTLFTVWVLGAAVAVSGCSEASIDDGRYQATLGDGSGSDTGLGGDPECEVNAGSGDADEDGISDDIDVCPCLADASQRDFDGDGRGDACDNALLYKGTSGDPSINALSTTVRASAGAEFLGAPLEVACAFDIEMPITDGELLVRLGEGTSADVWLARLDFEDTGVRTCALESLGFELARLEVELTNIHIESALPYATGFDYALEAHDVGELIGDWREVVPVAIYADYVVHQSNNHLIATPGPTKLRAAPGVVGSASTEVMEQGGRLELNWNDPEHVFFDEVVSDSGVRVELVGMHGTLVLNTAG